MAVQWYRDSEVNAAHISLMLAASLASPCVSVLRSAQPAWWRCQNGYRQLLWIYPRRCCPVQVRLPHMLCCSVRTCCIMSLSWNISCVCVLCRWLRYVKVVCSHCCHCWSWGRGRSSSAADGCERVHTERKTQWAAIIPSAKLKYDTGSPFLVIHPWV